MLNCVGEVCNMIKYCACIKNKGFESIPIPQHFNDFMKDCQKAKTFLIISGACSQARKVKLIFSKVC